MAFIPYTVADEKRPEVMEILEKEDIPHSGGSRATDGIIYVEDTHTKAFLRACRSKGIKPRKANPTYDHLTQR